MKKGSGWFPDWDLSFLGQGKPGVEDEDPGESGVFKKDSSVKVLRMKGDFEQFLRAGNVVIVFFYKESKGESFIAAFGIFLQFVSVENANLFV